MLGRVLFGRALAQIAPARKAISRPSQNDGPNALVFVRLVQAGAKQVHHTGIDRILLFRLIQVDDGDAISDLFHIHRIVIRRHTTLLSNDAKTDEGRKATRRRSIPIRRRTLLRNRAFAG